MLSILPASLAQIIGTDAFGNKVLLQDNRQPALYTTTFGDCLGASVFQVSRFDAAYYKDNATIAFHMGGTTALDGDYVISKLIGNL
jgi:hypothetical protein